MAQNSNSKPKITESTPQPQRMLDGIMAFTCVVLVYIIVLIPMAMFTHSQGNLLQFLIFTFGTAFGIGFGIAGLRTPGKKSKILAGVALILIGIYLLPTPMINFGRFLVSGNWSYLNPWK
jgi:hypothetical protein